MSPRDCVLRPAVTWAWALLAGMCCAGRAAAEGDPLCGARCIYVALKGLDFDVGEFTAFKARIGAPTPAGYSLSDLAGVAQSYGARTLAVETTLENLALRRERLACIAHVDASHFVLVYDVQPNLVHIMDPPRAAQISPRALLQRWNGRALLVSKSELGAEEDLARWPQATLLGGVAILIVALSAAGFVWRRRRA
jgi:ABC-type bacteriocin/lantibiotic exporter with double-glycine peptidase domain